MADSTLNAIRKKVRRLTRSPSITQISNAEIDEYINTFVLYDMPANLKLFSLRKTFSFFCNPYRGTYKTNTTNATDQFYDFKNKYSTLYEPMYVDGNQLSFSVSRDEFNSLYPQTITRATIATGDGLTVVYTGTLSAAPMIQSEVAFSSIDSSGNAIVLRDVPVVDANGNPTNVGNLYALGAEPAIPPAAIIATNTINYVTGVYSITFSATPAQGELIEAHTIVYSPTRPNALLFFNNEISIRPIPDKAYRISFEVESLPSELLNNNDVPDLKEWWQYIAYGAAKKILEDRTDFESIAPIILSMKEQEIFVMRKTIQQQSTQRTRTIYDVDNSGLRVPWWGSFK